MNALERYPWLRQPWQRFAALCSERRLPHALLLAGPPGIGKARLAEWMVQRLLCEAAPQGTEPGCGACRGCLQHNAGSHPDCAVLSPDPQARRALSGYPAQPSQEAKRRGAAQRQIEVDQVRDLTARLVERAHYGGHRVGVLLPADLLGYAASNALLKLLEEPGEGTVLLLVADRPGRLAATIRSRCQWLRCAAPGRAEARAWLAACAPEHTGRLDEALTLTLGAPLAAQRLLAAGDEAVLPKLAALLARGGRVDPLRDAAAFERIAVPRLLEDLALLCAVCLRLKAGAEQPAAGTLARLRDYLEPVDWRTLLDLAGWVAQLRRHDAVAWNVRLLLEQFLAKWRALPQATPPRLAAIAHE